MKRILILIIGLIGVSYGQSSPTSAKTRFVNGIYLGTKLDSYFAAADSNAIYWRADSVVMAKYKGTARALAFAVSGGYLPISDTAAMLAPFVQYSDTTGLYSQVVRTFGTQTVGGNKTFTNDIFASTARIGIGAGGNASNAVLGYNVFTSNTTGTKNTAMGENSLSSNVSATDNTAFGWYSLDAATGSGNTGIGSGALGTNTSGSNNTALGFGAGEYVTGTNPNSTGTNSIYIGFNTKAAANGETNQTVIGHNLTGNGSNTVTIGNSSVTDNYFTGNIRGGAFIKSGGTSSQFLKADGSVDGTAYGTGTVTSVSAGTGMSFTTITSSGAVNADTTVLATRAYAAGLDVAKANTSLNNVNGVLSSTYGGAGSVSGILKANGSGVVSAAVNNTDFTLLNGAGFVRMSGTTPSYLTGTSSQFVKADGSVDGTSYATAASLSGYLPLSGGTLTGNLGIGTSPTRRLEVSTSVSSDAAQNIARFGALNGSSQNKVFDIGYIGSTNFITLGTNAVGTDPSMSFRVGVTEVSRFASSALTSYVPINGTSLSMSGNASVGGGSAFSGLGGGLTTNGSGSSGIQFRVADAIRGYSYAEDAGVTSEAVGSRYFRIVTNSAERARVTDDGTFLINTTTTDGTNKLIVNGGVKAGSLVSNASISAASSITAGTSISVSGNTTPKFQINRGTYTTSGLIEYLNNSSLRWATGLNASQGGYFIYNGSAGANAFNIDTLSNATFASTVYAQGYRFAYASKSSNYTLTDNDDYINVTASCTITLPTAVGRSGKRYVIKCVGSVTATIASTSSQTIDGNAASTYSFGGPNYNIMIVYSDGSNWFLEAWQTGI